MEKQGVNKKIKEASCLMSVPYVLHIHPFRAILPYRHSFQTFAKARWYGKPILQVLEKQFKAYDREYYEEAIKSKRIKINSKTISTEYVIKNGDKLTHDAIRQQPPVLDLEVDIGFQNEDLLVVSKPPSWTVHTGGGFCYNTLKDYLQRQLRYENLFVLHRLDRLTSGLIIFGKKSKIPTLFHEENKKQELKKMYYARVSGNFKFEWKVLNAEVVCVSCKEGVYKVQKEIPYEDEQQSKRELQKFQQQYRKFHQRSKKGEKCQSFEETRIENDTLTKNPEKEEKKIQNSNKKEENHEKAPEKEENQQKKGDAFNNKFSCTLFRKVWYDEDSDSSLLECYPITGRTHQIRIHLQHLGHSILNDVVYGGRYIGNESLIQKVKMQKQPQKRDQLSDGRKLQSRSPPKDNGSLSAQKAVDTRAQQLSSQQLLEVQEYKKRIYKEWQLEGKPWEICLHSYQYQLGDQFFTNGKESLPFWIRKEGVRK